MDLKGLIHFLVFIVTFQTAVSQSTHLSDADDQNQLNHTQYSAFNNSESEREQTIKHTSLASYLGNPYISFRGQMRGIELLDKARRAISDRRISDFSTAEADELKVILINLRTKSNTAVLGGETQADDFHRIERLHRFLTGQLSGRWPEIARNDFLGRELGDRSYSLGEPVQETGYPERVITLRDRLLVDLQQQATQAIANDYTLTQRLCGQGLAGQFQVRVQINANQLVKYKKMIGEFGAGEMFLEMQEHSNFPTPFYCHITCTNGKPLNPSIAQIEDEHLKIGMIQYFQKHQPNKLCSEEENLDLVAQDTQIFLDSVRSFGVSPQPNCTVTGEINYTFFATPKIGEQEHLQTSYLENTLHPNFAFPGMELRGEPAAELLSDPGPDWDDLSDNDLLEIIRTPTSEQTPFENKLLAVDALTSRYNEDNLERDGKKRQRWFFMLRGEFFKASLDERNTQNEPIALLQRYYQHSQVSAEQMWSTLSEISLNSTDYPDSKIRKRATEYLLNKNTPIDPFIP